MRVRSRTTQLVDDESLSMEMIFIEEFYQAHCWDPCMISFAVRRYLENSPLTKVMSTGRRSRYVRPSLPSSHPHMMRVILVTLCGQLPE